MTPNVDLLILSRTASRLRSEVVEAIAAQRGVQCMVYRVIGRPIQSDANRHATIARARNRAKGLGESPWAMFLDDDVILGPDCIAGLVEALEARGDWGALAADYLDQGRGKTAVGHVGMGATLFRREVLESIDFRWESGKCECRCCCEDLEQQGIQIGYLPTARARHDQKHGRGTVAASGRLITALDWFHFERFHQLFLRTLTVTNNDTPVTVVGYGLDYNELQLLANHPNVDRVVSHSSNQLSPAVRRVRDFQPLLETLEPDSPVAFWDAGDVMFQTPLDELWGLVATNPSKLLAVREPKSHPENDALRNWTSRIANPNIRNHIFGLLSPCPFINSGFAAATAKAMKDYLQFADRFLRRADLLHEPPADQLAMNYYCHTNTDRWLEVDEGWNYCLSHRDRRILQPRHRSEKDWDRRTASLPRVVTPDGNTVPVVHGNGHTLETLLKEWWARRHVSR